VVELESICREQESIGENQQALRKFLWAAQSNDVNNNVLSLYILYDYVMFRPSTF